jgi:hemolysin III
MTRSISEPVSGVTHLIAAILAAVGLVLLISKSIDPVKPLHIITFSIFGVGMILVYTSSTIYHLLPLSEKGIRRLQKIDHKMIYVFIAATYTPVCLIALKGAWGWGLFITIWSLALLGILLKLFWFHLPKWVSTLLYILMGWVALAAIYPISKALQPWALVWLFSGGVFYTVGALIYLKEKPNPWPNFLGSHEIFHIFTMLGSFSHFWLMYEYVAVFK